MYSSRSSFITVLFTLPHSALLHYHVHVQLTEQSINLSSIYLFLLIVPSRINKIESLLPVNPRFYLARLYKSSFPKETKANNKIRSLTASLSRTVQYEYLSA